MKAQALALVMTLGVLLAGIEGRGQENTNKLAEPVFEAQVVLEKASFVNTVRLSANYQFAVKNIEASLPLSLRLFQGSDIDEQGHDSITRLNTFFNTAAMKGQSANLIDPAITIQNTNIVTLRIIGPVWLFRDQHGKAVAIGTTWAPGWQSKGIIEQFDSTNRSERLGSETNRELSAGQASKDASQVRFSDLKIDYGFGPVLMSEQRTVYDIQMPVGGGSSFEKRPSPDVSSLDLQVWLLKRDGTVVSQHGKPAQISIGNAGSDVDYMIYTFDKIPTNELAGITLRAKGKLYCQELDAGK